MASIPSTTPPASPIPHHNRKLFNLDLPVGVTRATGGHLRYTSPKALRGEYVHRKIVRDLLAETPYSVRMLLPNPYEVHHVDYNKEHNCSCNFILLDCAFHSALTAHRLKFRPKWKPMPELMLWEDSTADEVPF